MKQATRQMVTAYNAGDIDAMLAKFAPDAVVMPPQSPSSSGSDEVRKLWTEGSASLREEGIAVVIKDDDSARAFGDVGWHTGSYGYRNASGQDEPGGHYVGAWENRDGKWLIVRFMWNEDHVAPTPPADAPGDDAAPEPPSS
jgi:ketosteroid isomerase-like protein